VGDFRTKSKEVAAISMTKYPTEGSIPLNKIPPPPPLEEEEQDTPPSYLSVAIQQSEDPSPTASIDEDAPPSYYDASEASNTEQEPISEPPLAANPRERNESVNSLPERTEEYQKEAQNISQMEETTELFGRLALLANNVQDIVDSMYSFVLICHHQQHHRPSSSQFKDVQDYQRAIQEYQEQLSSSLKDVAGYFDYYLLYCKLLCISFHQKYAQWYTKS
jgi:hypothetical protein